MGTGRKAAEEGGKKTGSIIRQTCLSELSLQFVEVTRSGQRRAWYQDCVPQLLGVLSRSATDSQVIGVLLDKIFDSTWLVLHSSTVQLKSHGILAHLAQCC